MKCNNCGAELSADTKFCSYCGAKIEENTEVPPIPEEVIEENENLEEDTISYAEDSVEEDYTDDYSISGSSSSSVADKLKARFLDFWNPLSIYGKIATCGIVSFALLGIIAFLAGRVFAGVISIIQIAIMVVALLMKKGVIKTQKSWIPLLAVILSFALIIPYFSLFSISSSDFAKFNWNEAVLADVVPKPSSSYGEITYNSENNLSVVVKKVSPKEFLAYIEDCKNKGFTIDAEKSESGFRAFNKEGYELTITYYEDSKTMDIDICTAMELGTLSWPNSEMAKLLPVPKSTVGNIVDDTENGFSAYVGKTSIEDYKTYVSECEKMGFTIDAVKEEKHFYAKNDSSFKLTVDYEGNNVILITIDEPEYNVEYEVKCVENLIFSKYDVEIYIDDYAEETLGHGKTDTFSAVLSKGTHTFKFVSAEDDSITGEVEYNILKDEKLKIEVSCTSSKVNIKTILGPTPVENKENPTDYTIDYESSQAFEQALNDGNKVNGKIVQFNVVEYKPDSALGINCWSGEHLNFISESELDVNKGDIIIGKVTAEPTKPLGSWEIHYEVLAINGKKVETPTTSKTEKSKTEEKKEEPKEPEKPSPVFYSTNDYETAKKGNTGVFAYRDRGGSYDIYWIIDFDAGYVYYFTEGNGENTCDRLKIQSGDLNDKVIITYHDGGDTWSYGLHFKYVNHPETLIMNDNNGFEYKYSTTDLDDALKIRGTKTIKDY